jgi:hypothetical protein
MHHGVAVDGEEAEREAEKGELEGEPDTHSASASTPIAAFTNASAPRGGRMPF